jgi:TRAP-type C4-dicarboxylate transport system, periplasmic component
MKRRNILVFVMVALMLITTVGLAACGGSSAPSDTAPAPAPTETEGADTEAPALEQTRTTPLTLNMATGNPTTHLVQTGTLDPLVEQFKEATGGMVDIVIHPGGSLATAATMFDDVMNGSIDFAQGTGTFNPGQFMPLEMMEMPMLWDTGEQATQVAWDLLENNEEFQKQFKDVKVIGLWATPTFQIFTKGKQVRVPADLQGTVLRAHSAMVEKAIQAAGGATVQMPTQDAYDAIDRGVITGIVTDTSALETFKLWDLIDYGLVGMNQCLAMQMVVMSLDAWNQLNDFEKAELEKLIGRDMSLKTTANYEVAVTRAEEIAVTEHGMTLTEITDEELAEWTAVYAPVVDDYIANLNGRGIDADGIFADMMKFRDAH